MKRYIKTDNNDLIIDLFFENQKNKFDGTEIYLDDDIKLKLNDKSISNEYGAFIFEWKNNKIKDRSQTDIDNDPKTLNGILKEEIEIIKLKIDNRKDVLAENDLLSTLDITQNEIDLYEGSK